MVSFSAASNNGVDDNRHISLPETIIHRLGDSYEVGIQISPIKSNRTLKKVALAGGHFYAELMETVQTCSLGEISDVLYFAGGKYRRSM
ncbi:MAG: hypothetical protein NUW37_14265 [Planctomycetes bacterium]|nr:hypothetical protein [Planctomycetota bacterium]